MIEKKDTINSLLFLLQLFSGTILSFVSANFKEIALQVRIFALLFILVIFLLNNGFVYKVKIVNAIFLIISVYSIFFLDFIFRPNSVTLKYFYNFLVYGGNFCIIIYSQILNKSNLVKLYCFFTNLIFIAYCYEPFFDYPSLGNYMMFGFNIVLPAFIGAYIAKNYFKKRFFVILEIVTLIYLLIYTNRSSFLTAIGFIIMYTIFIEKLRGKKLFSFIIFMAIGIICILNALNIIDFLLALMYKMNYNSHSLETLKYLFLGDTDLFLTGRDVIWESASDFLRKKIIYGSGIASFSSYYGVYPHNFILEILCSFGIIGLFIFCILWIKSFKNILNSPKIEKIFGIVIFIQWIIPLFFSATLYESPYFWMFIYLGIANINLGKNTIIINRSKKWLM